MARTSLHKFDMENGYKRVITSDNSDLKHLGFSHLVLKPGQKIEYEVTGEEIAIVLQKGDFKASVEWKGERFLNDITGSREDVFEELPTSIYLPPKSKITIESESGMEARIFTAPCEEGNEPYFCAPEDVEEGNPGAYIYKRKYRFIFGPPTKHNSDVTKKLIVGESVSVPGGWIGFPGHRHDYKNSEEQPLEEIFSIRVKGPNDGPGTVIQYSSDVENGERWNEFFVIEEDNNAISLPVGFHTSFAAPGCTEYLLWGLAGEEKVYKVKFDERYTSLENALY
ncbi:MAG: 5-deoxy-glucuronate isomerase [Firmicutes bacterium]|nr:5-deoxy-glucuronate isomerase [Bacillota bacterium]